jgi:UDPglucose 6-dehydrogenase
MNQRFHFVHKIKKQFGTDLSGKTFGVWGLAFKPGTDDIREAPSIDIISELLLLGAKIKAYDPEAMNNWKKHTNLDIDLVDDPYSAIQDVDALLVLTEWSVFKGVDLNIVKQKMKTPMIFDGRNTFDLKSAQDAGVYYESMGRKVVESV